MHGKLCAGRWWRTKKCKDIEEFKIKAEINKLYVVAFNSQCTVSEY